MESALAFATKWLPIFQAVGAIFSVGGAVLSWRYAIKARREREVMANNIVASRLLERLDSTLIEVKSIQLESLMPNGDPSMEIYQAKQQEIKNIFEEFLAAASASTPYLIHSIGGWQQMVESVANASIFPKPGNVESAAKHMVLCREQIQTSQLLRQVQQPH